MSDIEETAPENSLIDLSDNEIEIKMESKKDYRQLVGTLFRK